MKVARVISVYELKGDELLFEISISSIPLSILKKIIPPDEDDPELYKIYVLNRSQVLAFLSLLPQLEQCDFSQVELYYECYGE